MRLSAMQKGVGLVEVLVALLILSIAALGFVALQIRAAEAGREASNRIIAMSIARDIAEKIRMNNAALSDYNKNTSEKEPDCYTRYCTPPDKAEADINQTQKYATSLGMTMNILSCPNTQNGRQCIYVAWGKTKAIDTTSTKDDNACTESGTEIKGFKYKDNSTCIVMEVY